MEAGSDAGDRGVVVVDHGKTEADGQQQAREVIEVEGRLAAGGGEGRFHAVPDHQDGGERAEEILAHGVEEAEVLGEQIVDCLKDVLQEIALHGSAPSTLGVYLRVPYGMRKVCNELVMVPVTWVIFPAMLAWRPISVLMALVVASRCCLARMVCCSSREARSLLVS